MYSVTASELCFIIAISANLNIFIPYAKRSLKYIFKGGGSWLIDDISCDVVPVNILNHFSPIYGRDSQYFVKDTSLQVTNAILKLKI